LKYWENDNNEKSNKFHPGVYKVINISYILKIMSSGFCQGSNFLETYTKILEKVTIFVITTFVLLMVFDQNIIDRSDCDLWSDPFPIDRPPRVQSVNAKTSFPIPVLDEVDLALV
jgi:hypothetical protein